MSRLVLADTSVLLGPVEPWMFHEDDHVTIARAVVDDLAFAVAHTPTRSHVSAHNLIERTITPKFTTKGLEHNHMARAKYSRLMLALTEGRGGNERTGTPEIWTAAVALSLEAVVYTRDPGMYEGLHPHLQVEHFGNPRR